MAIAVLRFKEWIKFKLAYNKIKIIAKLPSWSLSESWLNE